MTRASLRLGDLPRRLAAEGQRVPIVVRRRADGRYQIVCGFRRAWAASRLRWATVWVVVRDDLDDAAACRLALADNAGHRSTTDLDRAFAVRRFEARGLARAEIAALLGLGVRQTNNVRSLLDLGAPSVAALQDHPDRFTATHALRLRQQLQRFAELDEATWVGKVVREKLSVAGLVRALRDAVGRPQDREIASLFDPQRSRPELGQFQLSARRIDFDTLTRRERTVVARDARVLLERAGGKSISQLPASPVQSSPTPSPAHADAGSPS